MSNAVLKVMSDTEVEKMHAETLNLFENVGFKVTHAEALKKLAKAGADVAETSGLVKFPRKLVQELMALAPSTATLTGLNGKVLQAGGNNRYCLSLVIDPYVIDYEAGPRRPVLEDVRRNTIVGESLDRIHAMHRMEFPVTDVPGPDSGYKTMEVFLSHTCKHVVSCPTSPANCRDWMDVMAVIADAAGLDVGRTPLMSLAMAVTSPLQVHGPNVEIMKMAMERCYPILPTVCPMAGTTSPYSVAGSFVLANAEALFATLLAQVYKPGHPCFYACGPSVTNMKSGHDLYCRPEAVLFKVMANQMGEHYDLPQAGTSGGTLTHRPDVQNGAESMMLLLASMFTRQNLLYGVGSNYNAVGMSAEEVILHCGFADMGEYIARGPEITDRKLATASIAAVGPGGNYLTEDLTLEMLRSEEFFDSALVDLTGGSEAAGSGMYEMAHQIAEQLVHKYAPTVSAKVRQALEGFFAGKYSSKHVAAT